MEKVKVSKEVGEALNEALKYGSGEDLLNQHVKEPKWNSKTFLPFDEISNWEMAQILINGYEVEETTEEKMLSLYNDAFESIGTAKGDYHKRYFSGYIDGIISILEIKGEKIKGIND